MPTRDREALSAFFAIHNARFNRCLAPGIKCDKTAIRAHSIQNSRTLDLLVIDNHVIAFRPRASATGITIDFNSVGRNEASTFTGLCPEHDRTIFAPIDRGTLDTTNRKQLFLLAYRAVTFELHAIIEKAFMVRNMYRERVKRGWDQPSELSPAGTLAKEDLLHAFITWRYRAAKFDDDLLSHNYANVESDVLVLENQKPCIAVSSLFTIEGITKEDDTVRIVLNVLPVSASSTVVIFSYHKEDAALGRAGLDRILRATGDYQKYELSKLVIRKLSNFYISPGWFAEWSQEKRERIKEEFLNTVSREHARNIRSEIGGASTSEHPDFMIF